MAQPDNAVPDACPHCRTPAPGGGPLPRIRLGPHGISRVICGGNPFNAGSHLSAFFDEELRRYYTDERVLATLRRCREVGINCWQSIPNANLDLYRRLVEEGPGMHYLSLGHERHGPDALGRLADAGCIGVAYHGEVTDRLFKAGELDKARDYLARIRDTGMLVGVSTHMPNVLDYVESAGWDIDFYMCCVYERHRTAEELRQLLGHVPLPVGEVYLAEDPPRMYRAMRQTGRPCLAFKILAAGRLSNKPESVEQAFAEAFAAIKPTDAVIVGMYDRCSDQPAENAEFARRFAGRPIGASPSGGS